MSVECLYGCGELDRWFGGAPKTTVPWPRAARRKDQPLVDHRVQALLAGPPVLVEVDPRHLRASQSWVVRHHAAYYLSGRWERTGITSADRDQPANRYPLITTDHRGRKVILQGHHRCAAALIEGRPVRARLVGTHPAGVALAVTPLLFAGHHLHLVHERAEDAEQAVRAVLAGRTVLVADLDTATRALVALRDGHHVLHEGGAP